LRPQDAATNFTKRLRKRVVADLPGEKP